VEGRTSNIEWAVFVGDLAPRDSHFFSTLPYWTRGWARFNCYLDRRRLVVTFVVFDQANVLQLLFEFIFLAFRSVEDRPRCERELRRRDSLHAGMSSMNLDCSVERKAWENSLRFAPNHFSMKSLLAGRTTQIATSPDNPSIVKVGETTSSKKK
jgi:hypothetical protein